MDKMIPLFKVFMSKNASKEVGKVLDSGFIGQGPKVDEFEGELKKWFGNDFLVTTNSATSAEHLLLHLLKKSADHFGEGYWPGINPGDEVLCTPLTCTATNWPVLANNFKIKWVDIDENNLNMDLDDLARKITPKTKAIMLVHWGGYPVDLDRVREIQNKSREVFGFKPSVIEDCAHGFGSTYKGKLLGNHGNNCTFSFQAIKHITAVDGGMLIVPHQDLYRRSKLIRWYGIDRDTNKKDFRCEADVSEWGFKFHMNDINATIGMENFKSADKIIARHRDNANYYDNEFKDVPGVTVLERKSDRQSAFWIYSMLVDRRQDFMDWMKECNIMVSQVHERNDIHSCVSEFKSQLPTLDRMISNVVSIPVGWWVTDEQREYIADCIKKGW
jgi:dTDP-4-amino-4,6-dideoxygalactose transaminase